MFKLSGVQKWWDWVERCYQRDQVIAGGWTEERCKDLSASGVKPIATNRTSLHHGVADVLRDQDFLSLSRVFFVLLITSKNQIILRTNLTVINPQCHVWSFSICQWPKLSGIVNCVTKSQNHYIALNVFVFVFVLASCVGQLKSCCEGKCETSIDQRWQRIVWNV